ncbi:hypothetical protein Dimus_038648 [Dionaea muscipula]
MEQLASEQQLQRAVSSLQRRAANSGARRQPASSEALDEQRSGTSREQRQLSWASRGRWPSASSKRRSSCTDGFISLFGELHLNEQWRWWAWWLIGQQHKQREGALHAAGSSCSELSMLRAVILRVNKAAGSSFKPRAAMTMRGQPGAWVRVSRRLTSISYGLGSIVEWASAHVKFKGILEPS